MSSAVSGIGALEESTSSDTVRVLGVLTLVRAGDECESILVSEDSPDMLDYGTCESLQLNVSFAHSIIHASRATSDQQMTFSLDALGRRALNICKLTAFT